MDKKEMMLYGGLGLVLVLILGYAYLEVEEHEQSILRNHCNLIHKNPETSHMEYDAATKMMMPKTYRGNWFYECDDGEWRMD
jgi:hypothetical protein